MSDQKFPILGPEVPPMLGRVRIINRMWRDLTKPTPSHLSIVGPRYAGKSVLMTALYERLRDEDSPYEAVILWDLGHQTPDSDEGFIKLLCQRLGEGLKHAGNEYGDHLLSVSEGQYSEICEVMDALHDDNSKVVMLWDGFDKPLIGGKLTRNLWDNLLDLCRKPSFRLVTGTRKELHQLIRDEASVTSDFWGVFEGVVRVGIFDETDFDAVLAELSDLQFEAGARTELINWSACFPPLLLAILNEISSNKDHSKIDNNEVNHAAETVLEKYRGILIDLWEDCPALAKELYILLTERGELSFSETNIEARACLIEKGFAYQNRNKLLSSCRLLLEHIRSVQQDIGTMSRLFGSWDDYKNNIRGLLERRLAHISSFDNLLYRLVKQSIDDIPDYPDLCLYNLTGIRDCALKLIWNREFGSERCVPEDIVVYWTESPRNGHRMIGNMMQSNCWDVPTDPRDQIRLLQLLTGSYQNFEIRANSISKDTYVLIDAIHNFRNRAQHPGGQSIHLGVAVAAIMTCLELMGCLERELSF